MTSPNQIVLSPDRLLEGNKATEMLKVVVTTMRYRQLVRGERKHIYFGYKDAMTERIRMGTYALARDCNIEIPGNHGVDYEKYHVVMLRKVDSR